MSNAVIAYGSVAIVAIVAGLALLNAIKAWAAVAAISATVSALLYQIYVYIDLGHYDPFTPIAFVTSWLYAFVVAAIAVFVARKVRSRNNAGGSTSDTT